MSFLHRRMRFWRTIMERSKPFIKWNHAIRIVNFKILVVKVVGKIRCVHAHLFANNHPVKTSMPLRWSKAKARCKIDHVNRVGWYKKEE